MSGRRVSLVLCSRTGELLGKLPAFMIDDPWWPEVHSVIDAARERFAVEVVVLRLVDVVSDTHNGGDVTYLAELVQEPPGDLALTPAPAMVNEEQPLRAAWARRSSRTRGLSSRWSVSTSRRSSLRCWPLTHRLEPCSWATFPTTTTGRRPKLDST
jgi:hypothetical protein